MGTGGVNSSLPVTAASGPLLSHGVANDDGAGTYTLVNLFGGGNMYPTNASSAYADAANFSPTVPFTWVAGDSVIVWGTYEAA